MFVGIDLGTTFSAIARVINGKAEVLPTENGERIIPSAIMVDKKGQVIVGKDAKDKSADDPYSVCQFVKRQMGNRNFSFHINRDESYTAEEISAVILRELVIQAEKVTGEKVEGAVITVPAYFNDTQRNSTKDAGEIAGINVLSIINEPTAAALAYCQGIEKKEANVVVYDLGGGTFDITVLQMSDGLKKIRVLSSDGQNNLGGYDFDNEIIKDALDFFNRKYRKDFSDDDEFLALLREKAERLKIELSFKEESSIEIEYEGDTLIYSLTREIFNSKIERLLKVTETSMKLALHDAKLRWRNIDKILLVGGSTRIPAVREMIKNLTGIEPSAELNPDEAVALGAAYYANMIQSGNKASWDKDDSVELIDVLSHSIGIEFSGDDGDYVGKVIMRNSPLPQYEETGTYTLYENQTCFNIKVYQGEDSNPAYDTFLGNSKINYSPKSKGYRFIIKINCDINGIINIQLFDPQTKRTEGEFTIERINNLTKKELRLKADKLKNVMPKEDIQVNRDNYKVDKEKKAQKSVEDELDSLIGLEPVKRAIKNIKDNLEYNRERNRRLSLSDKETSLPRFIFYGNPGTGKTTVARLVGKILYDYGLLKKPDVVETSRVDLVGEYIGQTAVKTREKIKEAMGGVLFIDEAYNLYKKGSEKDFGREAIDEIMKSMEDNPTGYAIIFAGYYGEMTEFLNANPGIKSRITNFIDFPDYSPEELLLIAKKMAADNKYIFTADGEIAFRKLIEKKKVDSKFGNAREVRNIMGMAYGIKARMYKENANEINRLTELDACDFGVDLEENITKNAEYYLDELNKLTGLAPVKSEINSIINMARYQQRMSKRGEGIEGGIAQNLNLCFTGNPGTGKTTVARLYANILNAIGVTKTNKFIEASRDKFVAGYSGQTALKTHEICERAYGGVLFVDEAYALVDGDQDQFGREALATLLKEMEDNRDKLVVILAGYTREINEFLTANSGLKSRISNFIEFPDYNTNELFSIFMGMAKERGVIFGEGAEKAVREAVQILFDNKDELFGNARDIRNYFDRVFKRMVNRVIQNDLTGDDEITILAEDVINVTK